MRYWEIQSEATWRLRARITHLNHASKGCKNYPNGMSTMLLEDITRELEQIRSELKRRKHAA